MFLYLLVAMFVGAIFYMVFFHPQTTPLQRLLGLSVSSVAGLAFPVYIAIVAVLVVFFGVYSVITITKDCLTHGAK